MIPVHIYLGSYFTVTSFLVSLLPLIVYCIQIYWVIHSGTLDVATSCTEWIIVLPHGTLWYKDVVRKDEEADNILASSNYTELNFYTLQHSDGSDSVHLFFCIPCLT